MGKSKSTQKEKKRAKAAKRQEEEIKKPAHGSQDNTLGESSSMGASRPNPSTPSSVPKDIHQLEAEEKKLGETLIKTKRSLITSQMRCASRLEEKHTKYLKNGTRLISGGPKKFLAQFPILPKDHLKRLQQNDFRSIPADKLDEMSECIIHSIREENACFFDIYSKLLDALELEVENDRPCPVASTEGGELRKVLDDLKMPLDDHRDGYDVETITLEGDVERLTEQLAEVKIDLGVRKEELLKASMPAEEGFSSHTIQVSSKSNFSKTERLSICKKIITASKIKIFNHLMEQFKSLYSELCLLDRQAWGMTNNSIVKDVKRDLQAAVRRNEFFKSFPRPELLSTERRDFLIEDLTTAIQEAQLDFTHLRTILRAALHKSFREGDTQGMPRLMFLQLINKMKMVHDAQEVRWGHYDILVSKQKNVVKQYQDEIDNIDNREWGSQTQEGMLKKEEIEKEKLIEEMMKLERKHCESIGCDCIVKERRMNSRVWGSGTRMRNQIDTKKVEEILNGGGP